jgi:fumarate hydratase class II
VSKKAYESGKTIRQVVLQEKILSENEFDEWLQDQFESFDDV